MQTSIAIIVNKILIFFTGLLVVGCASDPVPTYMPDSHPAHPEAAEVVYTAPPNPFKDSMSMNNNQSDEIPEDSTETHGGHPSHPMNSDGKKPEKSMQTEAGKSGHHHKEHK